MEFDLSSAAQVSVLNVAAVGLAIDGRPTAWRQPRVGSVPDAQFDYVFPSKRGGVQVIECGTSAQCIPPDNAVCVFDKVVDSPDRFVTLVGGFGEILCGFATSVARPRIQVWVDTTDDIPSRTTMVEVFEESNSLSGVRMGASSRPTPDELWSADFDAVWFLVFEPRHAHTLTGIEGADHAPPTGSAVVKGDDVLTFYCEPEAVAFEFVGRRSRRFSKGVQLVAEGTLSSPHRVLTIFDNVGMPLSSTYVHHEKLDYAVLMDESERPMRITVYLFEP